MVRVLSCAAVLLLLSQQNSVALASPKDATLRVELFPFVGTSFIEIDVPDDFVNVDSPLFGETKEGFLHRITHTPPFIFPVVDSETGEVLAPTGGNIQGEPVFSEMDGRLIVRVEALSENDSPSIPFRFNGLIDNEEARRDLEFFSERTLLGVCGRPHTEFPLRYARSDLRPKTDSLTTTVGLDIDGDPEDCTFDDDPATHEDESLACDAENIPGPDNGADITREDWRPRTAIPVLDLGRFLDASGKLVITDPGDSTTAAMFLLDGLLANELYTIWQVDTDPLGRPLPQGFPMGGAPANVFTPTSKGRTNFTTELNHSPLGAPLVEVQLPGFPPVTLPAGATVAAVIVWHTNAETNGGLDFSTQSGGGLEGG